MLFVVLPILLLAANAAANVQVCGPSQQSGSSGRLTSHLAFNQSDYPNNLECNWVIQVPQDKAVRVSFIDFDVEFDSSCRYDYLDLHDGGSTSASRLRRLCGSAIPSAVQSTGNQMALRFKTDSSINGRGFALRWEAVTPPVVCSSSEFWCRNEKCIPRSQRCNGADDCGDGSDEAQCNATCGYSIIPNYLANGYVVGGRDARKGSWPWQAQMLRYNSHYCGGTLVNNRWIVTAAHCCGASASAYRIALGGENRDSTDSDQKVFEVEKIVKHESYNTRTLDFDIALMKLKTPVEFNDYISPACMSADVFPDDTFCYTTGWGSTQGTGFDGVLKQAYVPLWNQDRCNKAEHYNRAITDRMICAGYETGGHDACQGDSGGPLVCARGSGNDATWYLAGATSWGQGCARPNKPGVYADVPRLYSWITQKIAEN